MEKVSALFIVLLLQTQFSSAATSYVDRNHTSSNDANPGTQDLPWRTLQHAAETAVAGDTVYIRAGTYNEHVYIENAGDAVNGHIIFSAYPGETPILDGTGVTDSQNGIIIANPYIKLLGLELTNWQDNAIWIENSSFFEISDCVVHDIAFGIGVADGSHDFVFNRVEAFHFDLYGFDVSTSGGADCYNGTFNDCVAHSARDPQQNVDGFALGHGTQHDFVLNRCSTYDVYDGFDISAMNSTLNRCIAYNCWNGGYKLWQDNVRLFNCIGYNSNGSIVELDWDEDPGVTTLFNCTFFNADIFTIWIENAADTLHMYNCILASGGNIGLAFEQMGVGNYRGDYNIFHNDNAARAIAVAYTDEFTLSQVESGDWTTYSGQDANSRVVYNDFDIFQNVATNDFHLTENSPAIDNGTEVGAPAVDYDGNSRPHGAGFDIGAYEYQGPVGVARQENSTPTTYSLSQNYPNPFYAGGGSLPARWQTGAFGGNPATKCIYTIPQNVVAHGVSIAIYNLLGQKIRTLYDGPHSPGTFTVQWDGRDEEGVGVPAGIYLLKLVSESTVLTRKMLLIR